MLSELSIIIPTLNEEHYLPKLLDSLTLQNFPGKLQIIVVDGGSTDKTIEKAEAFRKKIADLTIIESVRGTARQRNKGAQNAQYKYLLFLDADIILPSGLLKKIAQTIRVKERFVATAIFLPHDGDLLDTILFSFSYIVLVVVSLFRPVTSGAFLLTSKENHKVIGGFGEEIVLGEDADYGDRSIKNGAQFYPLYGCFVFHSCRRAQRMGTFNMIICYIRIYLHYVRYGPILNRAQFSYPYGENNEFS